MQIGSASPMSTGNPAIDAAASAAKAASGMAAGAIVGKKIRAAAKKMSAPTSTTCPTCGGQMSASDQGAMDAE